MLEHDEQDYRKVQRWLTGEKPPAAGRRWRRKVHAAVVQLAVGPTPETPWWRRGVAGLARVGVRLGECWGVSLRLAVAAGLAVTGSRLVLGMFGDDHTHAPGLPMVTMMHDVLLALEPYSMGVMVLMLVLTLVGMLIGPSEEGRG